MTYVIGDIHGEYKKLLSLMKHIPNKERLVFIGDYINKGKDSKKVVDYLLALNDKREVFFLLGNHEFMLLQAWKGSKRAKEYLRKFGFKETLESYLGRRLTKSKFNELLNSGEFKSILKSELSFFKKLRKYYVEKSFFIVHAGIPINNLGRFTLSSLEKMVFVREDYIHSRKKYRNKIVVFGHTAFKRVYWDGMKIGIDTGAVYKKNNGYGRLTALNLKRLECVDSRGARYRPLLAGKNKVVLERKSWQDL
jgi:serine/threonine protein phosphatase 1